MYTHVRLTHILLI